ncbi:MAG: NAD(P)H-hydrate dehydratase, partial [Patescibacteria group bacterium]
MPNNIKKYLSQIDLPKPDSHKGQNGRLLIIGGSELFHAASKWSLDIASKYVDMLFYSSVSQNNELIKEAKGKFWNGIVVPRGDVGEYIKEADCILIGPGMTRSDETKKIVNNLLRKYPEKRWVVDAGALQMVNPKLLNKNCIITPHKKELLKLLEKIPSTKWEISNNYQSLILKFRNSDLEFIYDLENEIKNLLSNRVTILLKGQTDYVFNYEQIEKMSGGNPVMT